LSNKIINEARSWLGTKFKHQGRIKKTTNDSGGCDCLGLIIGVAKNLHIRAKNGELLASFDQIIYPKLLTSNILQEELNKLLFEIEIKDLQAGDIILLKINNWPQHLAIVSDITPHITIIHSYIQARKVVEQHFPKDWTNKIVATYRFNAF